MSLINDYLIIVIFQENQLIERVQILLSSFIIGKATEDNYKSNKIIVKYEYEISISNEIELSKSLSDNYFSKNNQILNENSSNNTSSINIESKDNARATINISNMVNIFNNPRKTNILNDSIITGKTMQRKLSKSVFLFPKNEIKENNDNTFNKHSDTINSNNSNIFKSTKLLKPFFSEFKELKGNLKNFDDKFEGLIEGFFIAGLSEDNNTFLPKTEGIQSQCNHEICSKLPAIQPDILFKYPAEDSANLEISSFMASIFYPRGLKICYNDDPVKPLEIESSITNQLGDRFFLKSKQIYYKITKKAFDSKYKLNLINSYIQIEKILDLYKENPSLSKKYEEILEKKLETITILNFNDFLYIPITLVMITKQPFINELDSILNTLISYITNNEYFEEEAIFKTLIHLNKEIPIRSKGMSLFNRNMKEDKASILNFYLPLNENLFMLEFPTEAEAIPLTNSVVSLSLIEIFSPTIIATIFYLVKSEQKIIFHSKNIQSIPKIINCFLNLLHPLEWSNTLIPLLSYDMIKYTQSFMPFIMGMDTDFLPLAKEYMQENSGIYIIDIDNNQILFNKTQNDEVNSGVIYYPQKFYDKIIEKLDNIKQLHTSILIGLDRSRSRRQGLTKKSKSVDMNQRSSVIVNSIFIGVNSSDGKFSSNDFLSNQKLFNLALTTSELKSLLTYKTKIINLDRVFRYLFININYQEIEDYEKFLSFIDNIPLFNSKSYIEYKKPEDKKYFEEFLSTQCFSSFIQKQQKTSISQVFNNHKLSSVLKEPLSEVEVDTYINESNINEEINKLIIVNSIYDNHDNYYIPPFFIKDDFNIKLNQGKISSICLDIINKAENYPSSLLKDYIFENLKIPSIENLKTYIKKNNEIKRFFLPFITQESSTKFKSNLSKLESFNMIMTRLNMKKPAQINSKNYKEILNDYISKILTSIDLNNEEKSEFCNLLQYEESMSLFPKALFQPKFKEGVTHCLGSNSFSSLKTIINMYLINAEAQSQSNANIEGVRLVTKSLYFYYKNSNQKNYFLLSDFSNNNNNIWKQSSFWILLFKTDLKDEKIKKEEEILAKLLVFIPSLFEFKLDINLIYTVCIENLMAEYLKQEKYINALKETIVKFTQINKI